MTEEELEKIANEVASRVALNTKEVLTFDEAATYAGVSKSWLYKQTSAGTVPYYKPCGKVIFFNRRELEKWLLHNFNVNNNNG